MTNSSTTTSISTKHKSTTTRALSPNQQQEQDDVKLFGFVSLAAVVHSHLCWVYSVIYIAYYKISHNEPPSSSPSIRWRAGKLKANEKKKVKSASPAKRHHCGKKSSSSRPKPAITPKSMTSTTIENDALLLLQKEEKTALTPALHAFSTFPSNKHQAFSNIHQMIKNHRRPQPKQAHSDSKILPSRDEDNNLSYTLRSSEDSSGSSRELSIASCTKISNTEHSRKRDMAIHLLRSTFRKSGSASNLKKSLSSSYISTVSSFDEEQLASAAAATTGTATVTAAPAPIVLVDVSVIKKKRRDTILGITRKFSGRGKNKEEHVDKDNNNNTSLPAPASLPSQQITDPVAGECDKKMQQSRVKLFSSLPSRKK